MSLEVGSIVEGKVTGITKFGAFVSLEGGKSAMVHISEIASTYVKEIRDFVKENDVIKVKILSIAPDGKISCSIKRVEQENAGRAKPQNKLIGAPEEFEWGNSTAGLSFEDKINRFKQDSDDKLHTLKKYMDGKRGSGSSRRSGTRH